jgi:hypothetical protein
VRDKMLRFEKIPNYGHHMTMEYFKSCCEFGLFIDYDGFGEYATEDLVSNKKIRPSDLKTGRLLCGFTHVVWYNR